MTAEASVAGSPVRALWGELRYSGELARLLADGELRAPRRRDDAQPVLLIPGFMAGDASLAVLRRWLRRRGHRVSMSGIRRQRRLRRAGRHPPGGAAAGFRRGSRTSRSSLIGQSRGGTLARSLAVRHPRDRVAGW